MDLESLFNASRRSPTPPKPSLTPREQRAYDQFTGEYAEQRRMTRDALLGCAK
jgi:hypothetical protein